MIRWVSGRLTRWAGLKRAVTDHRIQLLSDTTKIGWVPIEQVESPGKGV
jgi:hypothetical protein